MKNIIFLEICRFVYANMQENGGGSGDFAGKNAIYM